MRYIVVVVTIDYRVQVDPSEAKMRTSKSWSNCYHMNTTAISFRRDVCNAPKHSLPGICTTSHASALPSLNLFGAIYIKTAEAPLLNKFCSAPSLTFSVINGYSSGSSCPQDQCRLQRFDQFLLSALQSIFGVGMGGVWRLQRLAKSPSQSSRAYLDYFVIPPFDRPANYSSRRKGSRFNCALTWIFLRVVAAAKYYPCRHQIRIGGQWGGIAQTSTFKQTKSHVAWLYDAASARGQ